MQRGLASVSARRPTGPDRLGDPSAVLDVGHDDLYRALGDETGEEAGAVSDLAAGDGYGDRPGDLRQPGGVPGGLDRLLEPAHAGLRQLLRYPRGGPGLKAAVAVDEEPHVGPDGLPDGRNALDPASGYAAHLVQRRGRRHLVEGGALHHGKAVDDGPFGRRGEVAGSPPARPHRAVDVRVQLDAVLYAAAKLLREADTIGLSL